MSGDAQEFWDAIYRAWDLSRPGRPHPYLVEQLAGASPATALELGCGDGANAIWLATQGWKATAVDASRVALERAAAFAHEAGVASRVRWQRADLRDFATTETFDLVAAFFVHTPLALDYSSVMARAADRVGRGGALLVVGHYTLPPWAWEPEDTDGLLSAGDLASALALHEPAWEVRLADQVERTVMHASREMTILDAVLHAVRA